MATTKALELGQLATELTVDEATGVVTFGSIGALTVSDTTSSTTTTTGALTIAGGLGIVENLNVGGNTTLTGELRGPATFIIDPAAVGDNTGTVVIAGNLQVDGLTTTINSTTLTVEDKNIILASGASDAAAASGAGITVAGASAQLTYDSIQDRWNMNKGLELISAPLVVGTGSTDVGRVENSAGVFSITAYTSRQFAFGNDSNGEHVRIDADGNVGIGTDDPGAKLYVTDPSATAYSASASSPSLVIANINSSAATNFSSIQMVTDGNGRGLVNLNALNNATASSADFAIQTRHNGTLAERMRITSAGNVGIGTANPQGQLDLGNATGGRGIVWGGSTGANHYSSIWSERGSASIVIGAGLKASTTNEDFIYPYTGTYGYAAIELDVFSDDGIKFYTAADGSRTKDAVATKQERMRINTIGNVGIGTDNPNGLLHAYKAADDYLLYGGNPRLFLQTPTGLNGLRVYGDTTPFEFEITSGSYDGSKFTMGSTGDLSLIGSHASSGNTFNDSPTLFFNSKFWNGSADVTHFQGAIKAHSRSASSNDGYLGIGANASANHLNIDASTGNVGIGTASPSNQLEVTGGVDRAAISVTNADLGNLHYTNRDGRYLTSNGTGWTSALDGVDPGIVIGGDNSSGEIKGVGIVLHNENNSDNQYSPTISFGGRSNSGSYNTTYAHIIGRKTGQGSDSNWSSGELGFYTQPVNGYVTNSPRMIIKSDGNVGIGTSSPGASLDVFNTASAGDNVAARFRTNFNSTNGLGVSIEFADISPTIFGKIMCSNQSASTQRALTFSTYASTGNLTEKMRIEGDGNVGIGTTLPSAKLHISDITDGGSSSVTSAIRFSRRNGGANDAIIKMQHDGSDGVSNLQFHLGGSSRYVMGNTAFSPITNDTTDLGTSAIRWRNIYTNDLHLSNTNKENGNDVDGTTGDWTIQEGKDNLYLLNNITGKRYKINMTEVD